MLVRLVKLFQWIGKHWAISLACFLTVAITVTSIICWNAFGKERPEMVSIYVTVTGLPEDKNMENRELTVAMNDTLYDVFSDKYPEIYRMFEQSLIANNTFRSLLGVTRTSSKQFYVRIDGTYENILTQAYILRNGAVVEIEYR